MTKGLDLSIKDTLEIIVNKYASNEDATYRAIYDGYHINEKNVDTLFNGLISEQAKQQAKKNFTSIIESHRLMACSMLEHSNLYQQLWDSDEEPEISEELDYSLQDGSLSIDECLNLLNSLPEGEETASLRNFFTVGTNDHLKPIVLAYLTSLVLYQMQIDDEQQETLFVWIPSRSNQINLGHAQLYGKKVNIKKALKHGFGINYGCNCSSKFVAAAKENTALLAYLVSIADIDVKKSNESEESKETKSDKRKQNTTKQTGLLKKIYNFFIA